MFIVMGIALAVYFNMADPQPRERDYFFVGSFFVFAMWVGIGASGIIDTISDKLKENKNRNLLVGGSVAVLFAISPLNMFAQNLYVHDRNGNFGPLDNSYNILQSCKADAILFTNGDNDTFPLWFLQEAMGVRQDVRIVNLSLINTDWYILQMKNETPHGAMKVPISLSDDEIQNIGPVEWKTTTFRIPVPKDVYRQFGVTDTSITNKGYIQYTMRPTLQAGDVQAIRVQDIIMRNIVETNAWKRPIMFAVTVAPDNFIGLTPYLQMQGLALELTPAELGNQGEDYALNMPIMEKCFVEPPSTFSTKPQYGFFLTNLNNPDIYYDDNVRKLMLNYRYGYMRIASNDEMQADSSKAVASLDTMESRIPVEVIPMDYRTLSDVARLYYSAGAMMQFHKYAAIVERDARAAIEENPRDVQGYYNPYIILLNLYGMEKDYQKSIDLLEKAQTIFPEEQSIAQRIAQLRAMMNAKAVGGTALKSK